MKDLSLKSPIVILSIVVVLGLLVYHITMVSHNPIQGFKDDGKGKVVLDTSNYSMFPYTTEPINSLDQYELEAVFDNEGDRELKQTQINQMTRRYPLDWTNYPPNSSKFQSEQSKYIEGFSSDSSAEDLNKPYVAIGAGNLTPPDTLQMEKEEKKILQIYAPSKANSLTTYDVDDAQALLDKIYKPKGLKPEVVRKDGNVFEVVRTRHIKDKVEYEDDLPDAPASKQSNRAAGEATIYVPPTATETAAGRDPFFDPTTSTRSDRSDYTKWTPGLERMFAPTYPVTDWVGQPA
jgi:hypothetical protein